MTQFRDKVFAHNHLIISHSCETLKHPKTMRPNLNKLLIKYFITFLLKRLNFFFAILQLAKDLLHPLPAEEKRKHKLKRLVQHPNSYFMDVKCPGCYKITTVFSHAQGVVVCAGCSTILCQPTGGRAKLTEGLTRIPQLSI